MKNRIFTSILLALGFTLCQAQKAIEIPVWPNGAPSNNNATDEKFVNDPDYPHYEGSASAILYAYPAQHPNGQAIVICPGGGYGHLAMSHEGHDMASWFNTQGITVAVLKYRMPNGHKNIPLEDAREALKIVRAHAADWGVDPHKVGIMGSSAGGHLASTAATHLTGDEAPDFQILLYPVITMDARYTHMGSRNNLLGEQATEEDLQAYSNENRVTDKTPRAFIALSINDRSVHPQNTFGYVQAMVAHNLEVSVHTYPIGGHGWGFRDNFTYKRQWTGELEKWLREINK